MFSISLGEFRGGGYHAAEKRKKKRSTHGSKPFPSLELDFDLPALMNTTIFEKLFTQQLKKQTTKEIRFAIKLFSKIMSACQGISLQTEVVFSFITLTTSLVMPSKLTF